MEPSVQNILITHVLTETEARAVAAMLKRTGYMQATIEDCRKKTPVEIAAFFQPLSELDRNYLLQAIAQAAKLMPKKKDK